VPGFEGIDQLDEDTYVGSVRAHVGPVAVRLAGKVWIAERNRDALLARMNAVVRRKASQIMEQFASNVSTELRAP
jgi:hypothetical protein